MSDRAVATNRRRHRQPRLPIEVRRQQALDAALRLIIEHGYAAMTMEAIAREADFSKPVLYNAYPDLGALLAALLQREEARAITALAAAMPPQPIDADATRLLLHWASSLAHAIAENPEPWRLMLIPPEGTPEVVRDHLQAGRTFALDQVRTLTRRLVEQAPVSDRIDHELTSQTVLAIAEHAARLIVQDPVTYTPERLTNFVEDLIGVFRSR